MPWWLGRHSALALDSGLLSMPGATGARGRARHRVAAAAALGCLLGAASCIIYVDEDDQPASIPCTQECGANAACDGEIGKCACDFGHWTEDPTVGEACEPLMTFRLVDSCDDGEAVRWRLFSQLDDTIWPDPAEFPNGWVTPGLGVDDVQSILCIEGEYICVGAESSTLFWGVGPSGDETCETCCFSCVAGADRDFGLLTCP